MITTKIKTKQNKVKDTSQTTVETNVKNKVVDILVQLESAQKTLKQIIAEAVERENPKDFTEWLNNLTIGDLYDN